MTMREQIIITVFSFILSTWPANCREMKEQKGYFQLKNNTVGRLENHATKISKGILRVIKVPC